MNDIFYKPSLAPDRDYLSDAKIPDKDVTTNNDKDEPKKDDLVDLIDDINKIKNVIDILPDDIIKIIKPTIDTIDKSANTLKPRPEIIDKGVIDLNKDNENKPPNIITVNPSSKAPNIFGGSKSKIVIDERPPLSQTIDDTHETNLFDIYRDFVTGLKNVMTDFTQSILLTARHGNFKSYKDLFKDYNLLPEDIPDNLKHVSDAIYRNKLTREQKSRLFNKLHNIDNTIYHLRAVKVSYELRKRYYDENKTAKDKDYLEMASNNLLTNSRLMYDNKYERSLTDLYKYLNSTVTSTKDCLETFSKESECKATLNKEGIDVLKVKEEVPAMKPRRHNSTHIKINESSTKGVMTNADTEIIVPDSSDNIGLNKVSNLALKWSASRGKGSNNPVVYSMDKRGGDMNLKKYGDCSSFARKIFLDSGFGDIGWTTAQQISNKKGKYFNDLNSLSKGDLMFFGPDSSHRNYATLANGQRVAVSHVGIYVGDNKFVDLSYSVGTISTKNFGPGGKYRNYVLGYFIGAIRF